MLPLQTKSMRLPCKGMLIFFKNNTNRGVEQLVARQAHNLEVACSSLASATSKQGVQFFSTFPVFVIPCFPHLQDIFCSSELEKAIDGRVKYYNERKFHESLDNLTPRDVYLGQGEKIKRIRETIKQNSINKRISEHKRMKLQHK